MSRLLQIGGVVLLLAGIVAIIVSFTAPGQVVLGLDLGLAAILVIGGFIVLGLAGVLSVLEQVLEAARRQSGQAQPIPPWLLPGTGQPGTPFHEAAEEDQEGRTGDMFEDRAAAEETLAREEAAVDVEPEPEKLQVEAEIGPVARPEEPEQLEATGGQVPPELKAAEEAPLSEEPAAEERARGGEPEALPEEATERSSEEPLETAEQQPEEPRSPEEELAEEPGPLYVLEERRFRGRPARLLSDGTVEAETDEGWLRFEDFDHLREYLDAMAAVRRSGS